MGSEGRLDTVEASSLVRMLLLYRKGHAQNHGGIHSVLRTLPNSTYLRRRRAEVSAAEPRESPGASKERSPVSSGEESLAGKERARRLRSRGRRRDEVVGRPRSGEQDLGPAGMIRRVWRNHLARERALAGGAEVLDQAGAAHEEVE